MAETSLFGRSEPTEAWREETHEGDLNDSSAVQQHVRTRYVNTDISTAVGRERQYRHSARVRRIPDCTHYGRELLFTGSHSY